MGFATCSVSRQNGNKATRLCPCGYRGEPTRACICDDSEVRRYRSKISGPLLDRIDLHVPVPPVPFAALAEARPPGDSESLRIRRRVVQARSRQKQRYQSVRGQLNAEVPIEVLRSRSPLQPEAKETLARASDHLGLSARSIIRVLRVARTIADLEEQPDIAPEHVAEAAGYRLLDRRT